MNHGLRDSDEDTIDNPTRPADLRGGSGRRLWDSLGPPASVSGTGLGDRPQPPGPHQIHPNLLAGADQIKIIARTIPAILSRGSSRLGACGVLVAVESPEMRRWGIRAWSEVRRVMSDARRRRNRMHGAAVHCYTYHPGG
jgi:hypothetical protein